MQILIPSINIQASEILPLIIIKHLAAISFASLHKTAQKIHYLVIPKKGLQVKTFIILYYQTEWSTCTLHNFKVCTHLNLYFSGAGPKLPQTPHILA